MAVSSAGREGGRGLGGAQEGARFGKLILSRTAIPVHATC